MNLQNSDNSIKIKKETKNKIKVEFDRTSRWTRFKIKYLSMHFLGTVVYKIFRLVLLIGVSYVILFPFISQISSSIMSKDDFIDVTVNLIPRHPNLDIYKAIITENEYFKAFFNTAFLSIITAVIQTFICSFIGYGFAKYKFKGNKILFAAVIFMMIVPHGVIRVSLFSQFYYFNPFNLINSILSLFGIKFRLFNSLNIKLLDSNWPMYIMSLFGLGFKNGLYIFVMRQFYKGIPDELEESAYIDGSGVIRTYFRIILPLSIPMMVTIFLFAFSWQWTDNFYINIFYSSSRIRTFFRNVYKIPTSLNTVYPGQDLYEAAIFSTVGLLIVSPLLVIYLFCQRFLVQGIERSGITG